MFPNDTIKKTVSKYPRSISYSSNLLKQGANVKRCRSDKRDIPLSGQSRALIRVLRGFFMDFVERQDDDSPLDGFSARSGCFLEVLVTIITGCFLEVLVTIITVIKRDAGIASTTLQQRAGCSYGADRRMVEGCRAYDSMRPSCFAHSKCL
jgi:hypothetical protein